MSCIQGKFQFVPLKCNYPPQIRGSKIEENRAYKFKAGT